MMKNIVVCALLWFLLVGVSNSYQDITKDEAWDVVNKFYKDILGRKIDFDFAEMKVDRIKVNKIGDYPTYYYRKIRTDDVTAKINSSNHTVYEWMDSKSVYESYKDGEGKFGSIIIPVHKEEQVKDLAYSFMEKLRSIVDIPSGLKGPKIFYDDPSLSWSCVWNRTIGAYDFKDENVALSLRDKDLEIDAYFNYLTHKTCDLSINITEEQAVKTAKEYFLKYDDPENPSKIEIGEGELSDLTIKYPSRAFSEPEKFEKGARVTKPRKKNEPIVLPEIVDLKPHLVYVVKFEMRYPPNPDPRITSPPWTIEIWVDAKTGDIVGGQ
jgi:hypothetical protein